MCRDQESIVGGETQTNNFILISDIKQSGL